MAVSCVVILVGLISIQYYLVSNVYHLEKRNYVIEIRDSVSVVSDAEELDVWQDSLQESIKNLIFKKLDASISAEEFKKLVQTKTDSIRRIGNEFLKSQEKDYPILKEHPLRYQYTEILFRNDSINDTILSASEKPLVYYGEDFKSKEAINLSHGNWYINKIHQNDDDLGNLQDDRYSLLMRHTVDVDISNWQYVVFSRMKWILIAAVGLLLAVMILFFYMFRSLFKQKKIAEIKMDLANNITHELKTPLASLNLIVKSLQKDEISKDEKKRNEIYSALDRQNKRLQSIVDRVMETSLDQASEKSSIEINSFLKQMTDDFHFEKHPFRREIDSRKIFLNTDGVQLERILQNLLENAQKYSSPDTEISLKSYQEGSNYFIEIKDLGKGIPLKEQSRIFDKFYRISEGNSHDTKGLGLGLYLSRKLTENLGGKLSVKSKPGEGSKFIIELPI